MRPVSTFIRIFAAQVMRANMKETTMFLNKPCLASALASLSLALFLGGAATAQEKNDVGSLDVDVETDAAQGLAAANRIAIVDADIEAAIARRIEERLSGAGIIVSVDLDRIEVATGFDALQGRDNSIISGQVQLMDVRSIPVDKTFEVTATAAQINAPSFDPDVTVLPAGSDAFYDAMVEAFALGVTQTIDALPQPQRLP